MNHWETKACRVVSSCLFGRSLEAVLRSEFLGRGWLQKVARPVFRIQKNREVPGFRCRRSQAVRRGGPRMFSAEGSKGQGRGA